MVGISTPSLRGMYCALYVAQPTNVKRVSTMCWLFLLMTKPFKTYDEQIEILKSRNLIIEDELSAKRFLEKENYYNVINGYKDAFLIDGSDNFVENTKFEYLSTLYLFDKELRHNTLALLLDVENTLKSIIAYEFSQKYNGYAYLDINSYNRYNQKLENSANTLIQRLKDQIQNCYDNPDKSNENVRHYIDVYGEIPIWVFVSHMTLTDLKNFFFCLKMPLKNKICSHITSIYGKPITADDLFNFLCIMSNIRNLCAHNLRLYNFKTKFAISSTNPFVSFLKQNYGKSLRYNNIISIAIIFYHLTTKERFDFFISSFYEELKQLLAIPAEFAVILYKQQNYSLFDFISILIKVSEKI